jgi:hypothetical protein
MRWACGRGVRGLLSTTMIPPFHHHIFENCKAGQLRMYLVNNGYAFGHLQLSYYYMVVTPGRVANGFKNVIKEHHKAMRILG